MKRIQILWEQTRAPQRLLGYTGVSSLFLILTVALFSEGCSIFNPVRLTIVHGKVTDQTGQPVDSMTILFAGTLGFSAGFPIKETLTDSSGSYELVVDVPKEYHSAGINLFPKQQNLLDKYSGFLIYKNGVQKGSCCSVPMGTKTQYDFVLLPK